MDRPAIRFSLQEANSGLCLVIELAWYSHYPLLSSTNLRTSAGFALAPIAQSIRIKMPKAGDCLIRRLVVRFVHARVGLPICLHSQHLKKRQPSGLTTTDLGMQICGVNPGSLDRSTRRVVAPCITLARDCVIACQLVAACATILIFKTGALAQ